MFRSLLAVVTLLAAFGTDYSRADELADKVQLCVSCHGENGVPVDGSVPVIAGQQQGYLYLELRDYKLGNRKNEIMQAIAADLSKPDMIALAEHFAGAPWPALGQAEPAPEIARQARGVESSAVCTSCHMEHYEGAGTAPRVGGQTEAYLLATMLAFRSGERANNSWMTDLLKTYAEDDVAALAKYLAAP